MRSLVRVPRTQDTLETSLIETSSPLAFLAIRDVSAIHFVAIVLVRKVRRLELNERVPMFRPSTERLIEPDAGILRGRALLISGGRYETSLDCVETNISIERLIPRDPNEPAGVRVIMYVEEDQSVLSLPVLPILTFSVHEYVPN